MTPQVTNRGALVVFEGPDGVGKTTIATALERILVGENRRAKYVSFPGGVEKTLGMLVYRLHHEPSTLGVDRQVPELSRQLLHLAAHVDAIENEILPELDAGVSVLLDRYWWSMWAYGLLGKVQKWTLRLLVELEQASWGGQQPDIAFLVARPGLESSAESLWGYYQELAGKEAERYPVRLLTNHGPLEETLREVRKYLPRGLQNDARVIEPES